MWITLAKIASPEIIGTSSAAISIATIFTTIAAIGIPSGVSRFLARAFHEGSLDEAKMFVKDSIVLVTLGVLCSAFALFILNKWFYVTLENTLIYFTMLLLGASSMSRLLNSIVIASLNTRIIPKIMLVVASVRTVLVIVLALLGAGPIGVLTGYISFEMLASILLAFTIFRMLRVEHKDRSLKKRNHSFKSILNASIPVWVPKLITVLSGANLGTVIVFGSSGSAQAASYFLSYAVSSAVFAMVLPLFAIAYPAVAAMNDGRKRFTWRIIKISIIISLPLSSSVIFYSNDVMNLLGTHYADASILLKLFLLAILPNSISVMIGQLFYAYGNYKQVLYIGLASSIPTTILYFLLVPLLGSSGAAISYLTGSITSCIFSALVARKISMKIHWKDILLIIIISFVPAISFSYLHLNYILGIISTVIISYVVFMKFNIINKSDVEDTLNVVPFGIAKPLKSLVHRIGKLLNNEY